MGRVMVAVLAGAMAGGVRRLGLGLRVAPPCALGQTSGCTPRFTKCGDTDSSQYDRIVGKDTKMKCTEEGDPYTHKGLRWLVRFDGQDGACNEIVMKWGECWGDHFKTSANYDCQGRCGPGCGGNVCSNWSPNCLRHDVCSYYYGASGGGSDKNCGDEFGMARGHWATICSNPGQGVCELSKPAREFQTTAAICN